MYPDTKEVKINEVKIPIFSFILIFPFNKKIIPRPALTNNPDNNAPKERVPTIYNSANITDEAQLGINPMIRANKGATYLLISKNFPRVSSPSQ